MLYGLNGAECGERWDCRTSSVQSSLQEPAAMALLLLVIGESDNQPLTEDPDGLLISTFDSPANFDLFPVYFEKRSRPSVPELTTETISVLETLDSQPRFSSNSRPHPQPFNLILNRNTTTNRLNLEDYFGTPEPPTIPTTLPASQLDQLSNIKIKHRSNTSPSGLKTHSKRKIIKKQLAKHKYKKNGSRGSKYPKHVKKPIKIRILPNNVGESAESHKKKNLSKRKFPDDLRRITTDRYEEEGQDLKNIFEKPIKTIGDDTDNIFERSGLEPMLGLQDRKDFLGRLRSLTGGQVVAVTTDTVSHNTNRKEESGKLKQEIEKNLVKNAKIIGEKKKLRKKEKQISQFEAFPLVDQKTKQSSRRQDRQLAEFRIQDKNVGVYKPRKKNIRKIRKSRLDSVGTVDRYRYENADGSITWGYKNEDGSFKEETIGVDCVTHGRFGYVDPAGEEREYSYTSGLRCDQTRKAAEHRSENTKGYFDYASRKFVMPDGRRVTVRVNQNKRARGKRF